MDIPEVDEVGLAAVFLVILVKAWRSDLLLQLSPVRRSCDLKGWRSGLAGVRVSALASEWAGVEYRTLACVSSQPT